MTTRLKDFETEVSQQGIIDHAQRMQQKLDALDEEFRSHHHDIVDLVDSDESLTREQLALVEHDDLVAELAGRIKQLITVRTSSDATPRRVASRRLAHVRKAVSDVFAAVVTLSGDSYDAHLLHQYEKRLIDLRKELSETRSSLLTLELDESDDLNVQLASLEKDVFDSSVEIKRNPSPSTPHIGSPPFSSHSTGVRLYRN